MAETANGILEEIEQARIALDRDLSAFESRVRTETDWKLQARRHPWWVIGGVVVLGFLLFKILR